MSKTTAALLILLTTQSFFSHSHIILINRIAYESLNLKTMLTGNKEKWVYRIFLLNSFTILLYDLPSSDWTHCSLDEMFSAFEILYPPDIITDLSTNCL